MFPKSTEFNKRVPKTKFYENLELSKGVQKAFVKDIDSIIWSNKLAPSTVNIPSGDKVEEIQVFTVNLRSGKFNREILKTIDEQIPYHILFFVVIDGRYSAWIAYKVKSRGKAFRVISYYKTGIPSQVLPEFKIEGINLDEVYKNFIRQIATSDGETEWRDDENIEQNNKRIEQVKKLKDRMATLQLQIRKEKQFNKQVKLNDELKKAKKELEDIHNG